MDLIHSPNNRAAFFRLFRKDLNTWVGLGYNTPEHFNRVTMFFDGAWWHETAVFEIQTFFI
jgi:hypothetical protein